MGGRPPPATDGMWYRVRGSMPEVGSSCEFVNGQLGQEAFHSPDPCIQLVASTTTTSLLKHAFLHEACYLICTLHASPTPFIFVVREGLPQPLTIGV